MNSLRYAPIALIALLAVLCWHYRGTADDWQHRASDAQQRVVALTQDNAGLAAANADLDKRNNVLLESLNERSQQLQRQQSAAANARRAYTEALSQHSDWSGQRVPADVADSLRARSGVQDASATTGTFTRQSYQPVGATKLSVRL